MNYDPYNGPYSAGIPMGLGIALAGNLTAMNRFSNLSQSAREELYARVHGIESPEEMRNFVDEFGKTGIGLM